MRKRVITAAALVLASAAALPAFGKETDPGFLTDSASGRHPSGFG